MKTSSIFLPKARAIRKASKAAFSILALSGFPFFRLRPPLSDERDREIDRKSMTVAMGLFWLLIVIAGASVICQSLCYCYSTA
jgi:hypothetical protein